MDYITEHAGYKIDDIVDVKFASGIEKNCKIIEMYRTREGRVRVMVIPLDRHGTKMEVDSTWVCLRCNCDMRTLMSIGCKCGGK